MPSTDSGRHATGRAVSKALLELRNKFQELLGQSGYSQEEILHFLTTGQLRSSPTDPEPEPERPEVSVKKVGLEVAVNTAAHHTDQFDLLDLPDPTLLVRRGQPFTLTLLLSFPFVRKTHDLRLVFEIGDTPVESKNTRASLLLSDKDKDRQWGAKLVKTDKESVEVKVFTPPDCIVGKWRLTVELVKKGELKPVHRHSQDKPIYILFNPWCKDDAVYMESEEELEEYVLDESGCIFIGHYLYQSARPWKFDQFTGNVLDCTLHLLDFSDLSLQVRGDPVRVVRKLSALINANDNSGVLEGNWSADYSGGTSPSNWTGSAKILEEYYNTKSPVKYGQCWVFSGLLTTVCRALGIPCRSITNYASAHDTDASTTIDIYYDEKMERLEVYGDSIWNFHCWNDAWMRRDDLPEGYGGWQACDATPQETSESKFQCGPCPLRAIKEGELQMAYDATFIFAEANGDRVNWMKGADGKFKPVTYEEKLVGKYMSTRALKKVRESRPESDSKRSQRIITNQYKYPEGSPEERAVVMKAYRISRRPEQPEAYNTGPTDVEFQMKFNTDSPVGQGFMVKLLCQNKGGEVRTLHGHGSISTMYYTGIMADKVAHQEFKDLKIKAGDSQSVEVTVTPEQYRHHLKDGCYLSFTMVAIVDETQQSVIKSDTAVMVKPELSIKAPEKGKVGEEFEVTVTFTNPMPWTLTDCSLAVDGPGITKSLEFPQGDVPAQGTFLAKLKLKPKKQGRRNIAFVFSSKELDNVTGEHDMHVQE